MYIRLLGYVVPGAIKNGKGTLIAIPIDREMTETRLRDAVLAELKMADYLTEKEARQGETIVRGEMFAGAREALVLPYAPSRNDRAYYAYFEVVQPPIVAGGVDE
jgi:hypothetical protein